MKNLRNLEIVTAVFEKSDKSEVRVRKAYGVGNFTKDSPGLKTVETQNGPKVVLEYGLGIAVNTGKDEVVFLDVQAWEKTAEILNEYAKKGKEVFFGGTYLEEEYDAKDGSGKRIAKRLILDKFSFTYGSPRKDDNAAKTTTNEAQENYNFQSIEDDEDVPF